MPAGQGFEQEGSALESAVSSGLADNLSTMLTITVREDQQIRLSPEQASNAALYTSYQS